MKKLGLILVSAMLAGSPAMAQVVDNNAEIQRIAGLLKSNDATAVTEGNTLIKKNKKNADLIIGIGNEYLKAGKIAEAEAARDAAQKASKTAKYLVFAGDIQAAKRDGGAACALYEQAIYFEPTNEVAYFNYALAYQKSNPSLAIQKLNDLATNRPDLQTAVYKRIADIHYYNNQFEEAAAAYRKVSTDQLDEDEIINQATSYFFAGDAANSIVIAKAGHDKNPQKAAFNRLLMFNNVALKNYDEAVTAGNDLFNNSDKVPYSVYDYNFYGQALFGAKSYDAAIENFQKAYDMDTTANRNEMLNLISQAYENKGDYKNAITFYEKYEQTLAPEAQTVAVLYQRGMLYYYLGSDENVTADERKAASLKADECFAAVCEKAPDNSLGYLWRGRANAQLDPETDKGLAKPYYEKCAEILAAQANPANNNKLIECYRYLCYFYFKKNGEKKDALSIEYRNKIAAIDPNNPFIAATAPAFK